MVFYTTSLVWWSMKLGNCFGRVWVRTIQLDTFFLSLCLKRSAAILFLAGLAMLCYPLCAFLTHELSCLKAQSKGTTNLMKVGVYFWFGVVSILTEGVGYSLQIARFAKNITPVEVMQCKWAPNTKLRTFLGTKFINEKFFGAKRVPHTWYFVSDPSRPNVFWTIQILEREKERVVGWGEKERINLSHPKYVWTVRITEEYHHVIPAWHPKIPRDWQLRLIGVQGTS